MLLCLGVQVPDRRLPFGRNRKPRPKRGGSFFIQDLFLLRNLFDLFKGTFNNVIFKNNSN